MQKNVLEIAGNLSEDAVIRDAGNDRQVLSLRVITSRRWTDKASGEERSQVEGHNVVRFGKKGQFDNFLPYLKKGQGIYADGTFEIEYDKDEEKGQTFVNNRINASFGGDIQLIASTSQSINRHRIGGYLARDAEVRDTAKGSVLSFTVMTTESWGKEENQKKTVAHNVVKFGDKGEFDKVAQMLKTGAGVIVLGSVEKKNNDVDGKKYLNIHTNISFENIIFTKYVTEKGDNGTAPAKQEPAKQDPAPQEPAKQDPAPQEPSNVPEFIEDEDDDIPFG